MMEYLFLRKSLGLTDKLNTPSSAKPAPTRAPEPSRDEALPTIKILSGQTDKNLEIKIKEKVTYIGTADQALIKTKGFLAPSLAAAISETSDGFFLKAIKKGYPKVNGKEVADQVLLESGSLIECGSTSMVFYLPKPKKEPSKSA